jgi:hypothetical protein
MHSIFISLGVCRGSREALPLHLLWDAESGVSTRMRMVALRYRGHRFVEQEFPQDLEIGGRLVGELFGCVFVVWEEV